MVIQIKINSVCVNSGIAKLCKYIITKIGLTTEAIEIIIEVTPILKSVFIKRKPNKNILKVYPIK